MGFKRRMSGKQRGGVMDAGRRPAAYCQHLHCILPDITLRRHLPPNHTQPPKPSLAHTRREDICKIISVSWHWINIHGRDPSSEKSPAGKIWLDRIMTPQQRNLHVIKMGSGLAAERRSKGRRLVKGSESLWLVKRGNNKRRWSAGFPCELQDCPLLVDPQLQSQKFRNSHKLHCFITLIWIIFLIFMVDWYNVHPLFCKLNFE